MRIVPTHKRVARFACLVVALIGAAAPALARRPPATRPAQGIPDQPGVGGESKSIVQVGNLVYAGTMTSKCFSDHFLVLAEQESTISTSRRLHPVSLASDDVFAHPLVVMSGEGEFKLTPQERDNLRRYVENGGLVLASAGCSSPDWDRSFRAAIAETFPKLSLAPIKMDHPLFHTVYDINELHAKHGTPAPLQGLSLNGRLGVIYSFDGLNNTANTDGCCCCGGNEITNCEQVNVNILAYALTH